MARRIISDDVTADEVETHRVVERPSIASTIANVLTVLYVAIIALIGLDVLFEAMDARESNGFVNAIDALSGVFLAPFRGMFDNQNYVATALVAVVVYTLGYVLAMAALRRDRF